jgi:hypothetical protein
MGAETVGPAETLVELLGERTGARSLTGQALVAAMQASHHRDVDLAPGRSAVPVRWLLL